MLRIVLIALMLLSFPGASGTAAAQDVQEKRSHSSNAAIELELKDGSLLRGTILSETETTISFRTLSGSLIDIRTSDVVRRRRVVGRMTENGFLQHDPNTTRLLFGPTAQPLKSGNGYIAAHELFLLSGAVGVGDFITLWGGASIVPGAPEQLIFAAPKFTLFNRGNKSLATGFALGTVTGGNDSGGIMYTAGTLGGAEQAVTFGTGFLFGGGEVLDSALLMFGGHKQLSSRIKLISENYAMPAEGGGVLMSAAVRFIGGFLTTDFGGITHSSALTGSNMPIIPWLSFSYHFLR